MGEDINITIEESQPINVLIEAGIGVTSFTGLSDVPNIIEPLKFLRGDTTAIGSNSVTNATLTFTDSANKDFSLASSDTEAIDAGISLSAYFTTDISGTSRPQGSAWDIGAFEYVVSTSTGNIKIYTGSSFEVKTVKIYNGSSWEIKPLKVYNGSTWDTINY